MQGISISRVVAFVLTPILTAASTAGSAALAKYGLNVNPTAVVAFGLTTGTATATAAVKWLHGRAAFEHIDQAATHAVAQAKAWADAHGLEQQVEALQAALESAKAPVEAQAARIAQHVVEQVAKAIDPAALAAPATEVPGVTALEPVAGPEPVAEPTPTAV